jgi:lysophospholipase L1-like esterase
MAGFLEKNVAPCIFIDSLKFSKPGQWATVDGQHFNQAGYQAWSANITKALAALPLVQGLKK